MRTRLILASVLIASLAFASAVHAAPLFAGFLSPPWRASHAQVESDTVAYSAAWNDSIAPTGTYVWTWTVECATSATSTGLRYWFLPAGFDTSYIVRDTIEPGYSYTWDVAPTWVKVRGITAATTYRIRFHMD